MVFFLTKPLIHAPQNIELCFIYQEMETCVFKLHSKMSNPITKLGHNVKNNIVIYIYNINFKINTFQQGFNIIKVTVNIIFSWKLHNECKMEN